MATLATLTQATWNLLYGVGGFERPKEDQASGAVATGDTDLSADVTTGMWREGDMMEFPSGEMVMVVADTASTVNRARDGTTAETLASGDIIIKNPDFPRHKVEQAIGEVIRTSLWPQVWSWHHDTLTFSTSDHMYDLDQYVEDVVLVYQENLNADERFHPFPNNFWSVERQINSAVATNTGLLRLKRVWDEDETIYYTAKRRPHTDDLANLSDELADIVPYAVAGKLAVGRSVQQKRHRTSERRGKEFLADYEGFMSEFIRMRQELSRLLHAEVPRDIAYKAKRRRRW